MLNLLSSRSPQELLIGFALLGVILALPLEMAGLRRLRRAQIGRGALLLLLGAAVVLLGVLAAVVAAGLHSYARLTHEQVAAHVALRARGPQDFVLTLDIPDAAPHEYELRGDEWQIDARVLKWRAIGTVIGFDTVYRLERLSGRYSEAAQELTALRTVYPLWHTPRLDLWQLARRYHD
ncbi:MAG: hypothetical protein ACREUK_02740, partial [Burkholderiales bacterium]